MSFRMQTSQKILSWCRNSPELPVGKHREICQVTQSLAEGRGLNIRHDETALFWGEFTGPTKKGCWTNYIYSKLSIKYLYIHLLTSHFLFCFFSYMFVNLHKGALPISRIANSITSKVSNTKIRRSCCRSRWFSELSLACQPRWFSNCWAV